MPITPRPFPIPLVALILLAAPLGCNSDTPGRPEAGGDVAATRLAPTSRNEAIPPQLDPTPAPGDAEDQGRRGRALKEIHQDFRQATVVVEEGFDDLKGGVTRAVGAAPGGVQDLAGEVRNDASQAVGKVEGGMRQAVDKVVGGVQKEVEGVKGDVRQRARSIQDEVKQSAQGLKKDVVDGLFGPSK
jgi:gas vesicle protein